MKNFTKRIFSLLTVTVLVTSVGCNQGIANEENNIGTRQDNNISTNQVNSIPMGTYLTEEIGLPDGPEDYIAQDEIGNIYCYDIDKDCTVYSFNTEGSWG